MEQVLQVEPKPETSIVKERRRNAMQTIYDTVLADIETTASIKEKIEKVSDYINTIKGTDYHLEQAALRLKELLELDLEVEIREKELDTIFPGFTARLAANDSSFGDARDAQYAVK